MAQPLQPLHQIAAQSSWVQPVKVVATEFLVFLVASQHLVNRNQDTMCDGDERTVLPSACRHPAEQGRQVGIMGVRGSPGSLAKDSPQPAVAFAGFAGVVLPGALIVAWADARPGGEMLRCWELLHADTDFRYHSAGRDFVHAGNASKPFDEVAKRLTPFVDLLSELGDLGIERLQLSEKLGQLETVMLPDTPLQRQPELLSVIRKRSFLSLSPV